MSSGRRPLIQHQPHGRGDTVYRVPPYGHGMRLDAYLAKLVGEHSRAEWQRLIQAGAVLLRGRPAQPAMRVAAGDAVIVRQTAQHVLLTPDPSIPLDVVYADAALIVVNKPPGLVVHPAPGNEEHTLVHALLARFPELHDPTGGQRPGIVHRLDKDTSGLIMIGRTVEAVAALQAQMQAGEVVKRYYLLVLGDIAAGEGMIEAPIGRDPRFRQRMAVRAEGRPALTRFWVRERFGRFTFVEAELATGRTHQLRVHFAYIGHPVAGDKLYGSGRRPPGLRRQFVHAHYLRVRSPATGAVLELEAPLPPDLAEPLAQLRGSPPTTAGTGEPRAGSTQD
ncbi:MAG: RluA family pseudouridine synthase [Chloroflexi bacterium]|nr:RluA family pseudouridine synthase [Chloroflexota bacterium]